jgi:hypothetical protein
LEISTLLGLPAHPLIVHAVVVTIPLVALLLLCYVLSPGWRTGLFYPLLVMTMVMNVSVILAAGSGESLEHALERTQPSSATLRQHTDLGGQTETITLIFGGITLVYLLLQWWSSRPGGAWPNRPFVPGLSRLMLPLGIVALLAGAIATTWDVRAGHSGAESVWSNTDMSQREDSDDDD